jgi:hypothetical protein
MGKLSFRNVRALSIWIEVAWRSNHCDLAHNLVRSLQPVGQTKGPAFRDHARARSIPIASNDGPDGAHRLVDSTRRLSVAGFQLARTGACFVKFGRQSRSIDVKDMNLLGKRTTPTVGVQPRL